MARKATGQVIPPKGKQRSWAIRFTAYGKRRFVSLGRPEDGWDRERAEGRLRHVLADVERGIWRSHEPELVEPPREEPTFHEFASEWFERHRREWRENNQRLPLGADLPPPPPLRQTSAERDHRRRGRSVQSDQAGGGTASAEPDQQVPDPARADPRRGAGV
jgi:hypothetical protein